MQDFSFIIPQSNILAWYRQSTSLRPMGGILIVSKTAPNANGIHVSDPVRAGIMILPIYWNLQDRASDGTPASFYNPDFIVNSGATDTELLSTLRNEPTPTNSTNVFYPVIYLGRIDSTWPVTPEVDFALAFLNIDLCKYL